MTIGFRVLTAQRKVAADWVARYRDIPSPTSATPCTA